ncbi:hypothetical protein OEZ86_014008 [Tetradesmus obliquus]|nr:hypothetical protein OEZ86_014008 [Tetradesmus obliquus]
MQMQLGYCTVTVVEPLQLLATAPDLAYLKDATVLIKELHDFLNAAEAATPEGSNTTALMQELVQQHSIAKLLAQACSRVLQLMLRATSKERSKPALLRSYVQLQQLLPSFLRVWAGCTAHLPKAEEEAMSQLVLQQLQETDIFPTFLAACQRDTAWLERQLLLQHTRQQQPPPPQQQQQRTSKQSGKKQRHAPGGLTEPQADAAACVRIHAYLRLFMMLAASSVFEWLAGPLAAHMELCLRLAWAVLRCQDSCRDTHGSSTPYRTAEEGAKGALRTATEVALTWADMLAQQFAYNAQHEKQLPQLADASASVALYCLLLANLAQHVMALHEKVEKQGGGCVALPEQHHRLLLQELGIGWLQHSELRKHTMSMSGISVFSS